MSILRQQAIDRIRNSDALKGLEDFVKLGDGSNDHWRWIIQATDQDILDWLADVRVQIEGREYMNQLASRLAEQEAQL